MRQGTPLPPRSKHITYMVQEEPGRIGQILNDIDARPFAAFVSLAVLGIHANATGVNTYIPDAFYKQAINNFPLKFNEFITIFF